MVQLGTHTDVFEQLGFGQTMNSRLRTELNTIRQNANGPKDWIDSWTMFYWGMWIGWSPFVGNAALQNESQTHNLLMLIICFIFAGMFIAKISRGRTIREFIHGTLTAPVVYSFIWMIMFGGIGLRKSLKAHFT